MNILLVEDNAELALWLGRSLHEARFTVTHAADGETALAHLAQQPFDLLLLDLNLPDMNGRAVLRRLRRSGNGLPVLVLTASASLDIKVDSLDMGADDYLVKPFEMRELVARIKVLIRRHSGASQSALECGDLHYDLDTRTFTLAGATLALPPREHSLLEALMLRQGKTTRKDKLAQTVFGPHDEAGEDAIELYIHRLRRRLDTARVRILTLRGLGYLLQDSDAAGAAL
ncbi:response regulator [Amphibiibacter pelophylacis]|uniref:Response regulator n=1 Tax=Amphibiibacter pelophylacis TaxID=1799477 RepID=A0ACC6P0S7_9BURK